MSYVNKSLPRFLVLLFVFFMISFGASAQTLFVDGIVEDEEGEPLVGVNVIEVDKNNRMLGGSITNFDGAYTIKCSNSEPILKFSFIGMVEQRIQLKPGQKKQDVVMYFDTEEIEGVDVTAVKRERVNMGYINIDKREATGAVSVVNLEDVAPSHVSDVGEMLQGQSSGLLITSNSGDPGAGVTIRIRGSASLNANSNPLIVVDGVPMEIQGTFENLEDFTDYSRSPLSDINPEDIESISVLKDASSTAIYGSRGANGVILINTKRGKSGKTTVTFSSKLSTQPGNEYLPLLTGDDLKTLWLEMDQNAYGLSNSVSGTLTRPELRDDPNRSDYQYFNNNTVWTDEITKNGFTHDNSLSISGGGEAVKFSMNLGYVNQTGNIVNTDYQKYTSSFKLDYRISDKIMFSGNLYYTRHNWNRTKDFGDFDNPLSVAYRRPSFLPVYSPENPDEYSYFYWDDESNVRNINPLAQAMNATNDKFTDNISTSITLNAILAKDLTLNSYVSYKNSNSDYNVYFPYDAILRTDAKGVPYTPWTNNAVNQYYFGNSYSQDLDVSNTLSYRMKFNEKHDLRLTGVQSLLISSSSSYAHRGANTGSSGLQFANATNNWLGMSASEGSKTVLGFRGKLIYIFDDRFGLDLGLNTDASSNFGPDYRWGLFPNAGAFWRASSENFADSWEWLDDLKIRASWGQAGRSPNGSYNHLSTYNRGENGYNGQNFVEPGNTQLKELRWETSETFDVGLEMQMFKNRVYAEIGYYKQSTFDLLTDRLFPASSGINDKDSKLLKNFGDMSNKGYEMSVNVTPIKTKDIRWDLKFNMATQKSKITRWPSQDTEWSAAGEEVRNLRYSDSDDYAFYLRVREGDPLGAFYGYQVDKIMPVYSTPEDVRVFGTDGQVIYDVDGEPLGKYNSYSRNFFEAGDVNYIDQNNDGVINDEDIVYLGDANPDAFGGVSTRLSYKNWSMNVFFNYMIGNDILNWTKYGGELLKKPSNFTSSVMKRWRKPGDITEIPRAVNGSISSYNNELGGDRYVEDGSFIRLQSLALSYALPRDMLRKVFVKNAVLTLSAYNLFTWTGYTGVDPEVSYTGKPFQVGIDNAQTPKQSSYTLNIKVVF